MSGFVMQPPPSGPGSKSGYRATMKLVPIVIYMGMAYFLIM
jgi:hypothetical protein